MTKREIAARLIVLEHRADELVSDIQVLFQDVLDSITQDDVE